MEETMEATMTDEASSNVHDLDLLPDRDDVSWGYPALPMWVSGFRSHQHQAVAEIMDAFERGVKVVMVDAPTGSGKTLIGELVRRQIGGKAVYTCSTKTLQDQIIEDFDYARSVKGRANYPTQRHPEQFVLPGELKVSCDDCTGAECQLCDGFESCPYQKAKGRAAEAPMAVLNTAYLLGEGQGERSAFAGRPIAIIDEADLLENSLMGYVEVRIGRAAQRKYGITPPGKKTVKESWLAWCDVAIPKVRAAMVATHKPKEEKQAANLLRKLMLLRDDLRDEDRTDWVYTDYESGNIVFKPVMVDALARQFLWPLADQFLLMSASLVSGEQMAHDLGLEDGEWEVVVVESTFPVENRPVHVAPVATMTAKQYDSELPKLVKAIDNIIAEHDGENILIHTVSYKLAADLVRQVKGNVGTYTNSLDRESALARWKESGGVMIAPSLDRGVDLPGDLCRVQVIAKVPFPYLGDKQVQARLYSRGGQEWYAVQTVRTLIQMTGRGVRSADDRCVTYVLDRSFVRLYREASKLWPEWWKASVDMTGQMRRRLVA